MAEVFKNASLAATTVETDLYTCPASTTAILMSLRASDNNGVDGSITAKLYDDSAVVDFFLANSLTIPANAAVGLLDGKMVLETGDKIKITASANTSIDIVASILEIS